MSTRVLEQRLQKVVVIRSQIEWDILLKILTRQLLKCYFTTARMQTIETVPGNCRSVMLQGLETVVSHYR